MPNSIMIILDALNDPDSDASQVEMAIRYDPGLTASILRMANSALFGFPNSIASVGDAVVRLGRRRIMDFVLAASMSSTLQRELPGYEIPEGALWRHSIAVATAAEVLAETLGADDADDVFTCGLLHDVGKLVMGDFVEECMESIEAAVEGGEPFDTAERRATGLDHGEVGARILSKWRFPENLILAARYHHQPDNLSESNRCVDLVHMADCLVMMIGFSEGLEGLSYPVSPAAQERLGIESHDVEQIALRSLQRVEEILVDLEQPVRLKS